MKKGQIRRKIFLAACLLGAVVCLGGCGDDVDAFIPAAGEALTGQDTGTEKAEEIPEKKEEAGGQDEVDMPASEPTPEPTPEPVTITISAAGDCSLGNHHEQDYYGSFVQAYDKAEDEGYFFRNVKEIFEADDFTIVNLEGVLTTLEERQEGRTYNIKGDPSYVGILTAADVEAVSMGNNHRLDYGVAGTKDTVAALEGAGIAYAYDDIVSVTEHKGIRIGFLSVNEVAWGLGTERLIREGMEKLQEQEADLIIACCHWGTEKDYQPEEYQLELGHLCIDLGADLVLGHHPHVLQGIEEYQGRYIVHSLANFCFGANRNPADKDTMIYQQTFTFVNGIRTDTAEAKVIPCSVSSVTERNNFQPTLLEGEERERVIKKLNTYSEEFGTYITEAGEVKSKEEE